MATTGNAFLESIRAKPYGRYAVKYQDHPWFAALMVNPSSGEYTDLVKVQGYAQLRALSDRTGFQIGLVLGPITTESDVDKFINTWGHKNRGVIPRAAKGEELARHFNLQAYCDFDAVFRVDNHANYIKIQLEPDVLEWRSAQEERLLTAAENDTDGKVESALSEHAASSTSLSLSQWMQQTVASTAIERKLQQQQLHGPPPVPLPPPVLSASNSSNSKRKLKRAAAAIVQGRVAVSSRYSRTKSIRQRPSGITTLSHRMPAPSVPPEEPVPATSPRIAIPSH